MAKTISRGTVKGEGRQGTQKERWKDNIWKWTGLEIYLEIYLEIWKTYLEMDKSQRAVENREK